MTGRCFREKSQKKFEKKFNDGFTVNPSFFITNFQPRGPAAPQTVSKCAARVNKIFYEILKEVAKLE